MKARTARVYYLAVFVLAFVGVAIFSAILGISAVFPFAYVTATDFISGKFKELNKKRRPAVEAARAKQAELKKQQAKLNKEKKELEKKKKQLLNKQAKEIYEERVSAGYESSINMMNATYAGDTKSSSKKKPAEVLAFVPEKAPIVEPSSVAEPEPSAAPVMSSADDDSYASNGSMFRGISF